MDPDPEVIAECRLMADRWAPTLKAFANPDRLLIVLWLAGTRCSVRDLQRVTGLGQSLVSYHLRALREAGLVEASPEGRANLYRLARPDLDRLAALLGTLDASEGPEPRRTDQTETAPRTP